MDFLDYLTDWFRTEEQIDNVSFDRMKTDGMIDLLLMLERFGLLF